MMEKRNLKILEYYREISGDKYNEEVKKASYCAPTTFFRFLQPYIKREHQKILDIGCGTGQSSLQFIKMGKEVYGVDFSKEMIKFSERYDFKELKLYNFFLGLPYSHNTFDITISVGTFNLYKDLKKIINEMIRVTKPREMIAFTVGEGEESKTKKWLNRNAKVYEYLHSEKEMKSLLAQIEAEYIADQKIIAYKRDNQKNDHYHAFILKKKC